MKLIIDSLDDIGSLEVEDIQRHFRHCGEIHEIQKGHNGKHFMVFVPEPETAKKMLQCSGRRIKGVKLRASYQKSMAKARKMGMDIDDEQFTLRTLFFWTFYSVFGLFSGHIRA